VSIIVSSEVSPYHLGISALGHDYNMDCPPDVVVTLPECAYDKEAAGVG